MEDNKIYPAHNEPDKKDEQAGKEKKKKGGIHNNALYAASMGRAATKAVDPHTNRGLADTGTNISYEGATAPGAGGSVGTGYSSGQTAIEPTISTDSDYDRARVGNDNKKDASAEENKHDEEKDII